MTEPRRREPLRGVEASPLASKLRARLLELRARLLELHERPRRLYPPRSPLHTASKRLCLELCGRRCGLC